MRAAKTARRKNFGETYYSAALRSTYKTEGERKKRLSEQRKQEKRDALEARRQRIEEKKLRAAEILADKKIADAERKIATAEKTITAADKKVSGGAMTESEFARVKARMEREIEAQERHKEAAAAKVGNPSWGYGIYEQGGFGQGDQIAHFKSKQAAETYLRSHGMTGYSIKRAFRKNPAASPSQYRLAQAVLAGTARSKMPKSVAQEIVDKTPARLRSSYSKGNPDSPQSSTEFRLGYNLGQTDRQTASLRKSLCELHVSFAENFAAKPDANWEWFEEGYASGYSGAMGAAAPNGRRRNPEPEGDDSNEYQQALKTAELFHGRPVKEEIEVKETVRTHDWYVSIGPLIKLIIKPVTKKPKRRVPLPFHQGEDAVQLFCSPDGRQFYLRGGDQELDLKAFGMEPGTKWFRDHMVIGEAVEITYRDRKKFHSFKLTDYYHKLGEETGDKPMLVYDSLSKKLGIIGGAYHVEMNELVEGMSPGIVN